MPCGTHRVHEAGCEPCRRYARHYFGRRELAIANGTWEHHRPAREVRAHLVKCRKAPMTRREIARAAGVSWSLVCDILANRDRVYVTGPNAVALLAVEPVPTPPAGHVDPTRTVRQLQALQVIGFSNPMLTDGTGLSSQTVYRVANAKNRWITTEVAGAVDALYDRGRVQLAEHRAVDPDAVMVAGADIRTRNAALRKGWVGPDWWDDDTIGDPKQRPRRPTSPHTTDYLRSNVDDALAGRITYAGLTTAERVQAVRLLADLFLSDRQIGARLQWPASPGDEGSKHSPVLRFRTYHGIPSRWSPLRASDDQRVPVAA